jgi:hypothetical protein
VTGAAHEGERQRGEQERLAAGSDPVSPLCDVRADREKGPEHEQEAVPGEPDEPGPRIQDGVPYGAGLDRRVGAVLEGGRSHHQPDDSRAERHEDEETRPGHDRPVPATRGRSHGRSGQQEHEERPGQQHARCQVNPEDGEDERPHSMRKMNPPSVTSASIESTRQRTL